MPLLLLLMVALVVALALVVVVVVVVVVVLPLTGEQLEQVAEKVMPAGTRAMSRDKLEEVAGAINKKPLKHKINPMHPEKNVEKLIKGLTADQRQQMKGMLGMHSSDTI